MRVELNVPESVTEPGIRAQHRQEHDGPHRHPPGHAHLILTMALRPGSIEVGLRRSEMRTVGYDAGEMGLCPRQVALWVGTADIQRLTLGISDAVLTAARDGIGPEVELRPMIKMVDARVAALVTAVNAERVAGFPSGRLFLDSVEQALGVALVDGYAVRHRSVRTYRGGLGPARLRRIKELVHAKMEDELTLHDMAQSVGLSTAHFSQLFRQSTGESPHQFVLRHRVERAQELLRAAEARVLDVAVACGFKTQQHFARVFRRMYGASPTEYRQDFLCRGATSAGETCRHDTPTFAATPSAGNL
jgi:AraC family transcriptional regulator